MKPEPTGERQPASWLTRFASRSAETLSSAFSRFPFAVLAIGVLAGIVNLDIAGVRVFDDRHDVRVVTALAVGAAISIAATLLFERMTTGALACLAGAAAAGIVASALVWFGWNGFLFVPPFVAASILVIPLAPHIAGSNSRRFWTFLLWTSFGATLGFVSVMLFVLGVSAILEMVRYLFGIGLGSDAYEHIYATAVLFVGPVFALGRIPRDFDEEASIDHTDRFITGIGVLQNWVALPLVLAAAAILHLYVAKIVATGEVPKNQIGWIAGSYALFVLSLRVAAAPFVETGGAAQRLFGRLWVPILVAPIALLSYALWLRIGAEGFTAERYYLALAALAAGLIAAAQAIPVLCGDVRVMAMVPVALLAASSFGPWGGAATVGRSQTALIVHDFIDDADGHLHPERLDEPRRDVLRSRIRALAEVDALSRIHPLMTDEARSQAESSGSSDATTAYLSGLGIEYGTGARLYTGFAASKPVPFDVTGFDTVQMGLQASESGAAVETSRQDAMAGIDGPQLVIRLRGIVDRIDSGPIAQHVPSGNHEDGSANEPIIVNARTAGGRNLRLRITYFGRIENDVQPVNVSFDLAFRSSEWAQPPVSLGGNIQR